MYNEDDDEEEYFSEPPTEEVKFMIGEAIVVKATVELTVVTDSNYGADADGNRGISRDFVENSKIREDSIEIIYARSAAEKGREISFDKLSKRNKDRVLALIDKEQGY